MYIDKHTNRNRSISLNWSQRDYLWWILLPSICRGMCISRVRSVTVESGRYVPD